MPANLPPQYISAEERYREAKTDGERLEALEEMYALLPKHKGTDKIQADLKRRISRIRKGESKRSGARRETPYRVERMGAGQVVLVGPPNAGKSSLASSLSGVELKEAPYPFATLLPTPAMMPHLDIQIQLVDLPPVTEGHLEGWQGNLIRGADGCLLVFDAASDDVLEEAETVFEELEKKKILLRRPGEEAGASGGWVGIDTLAVATKMDLPRAEGNAGMLREWLGGRLPLVNYSSREPSRFGAGELKREIFALLGVIRVYSKAPGSPADMDKPFVLPEGSTLLDFAEVVHRDFSRNLKSARLWGSARFDGQAVSRDHLLRDGDVAELSI